MKREDSSMNNNMNMNNSNASENMNMAVMSVQTKKKSGNARRFLLLVILLICTVALLGGATYAWFTANTKVRVQEMEIQVTVAKGIEISSDATTWGPVMSLRDLYRAGGMSFDDPNENGDSEDAGSVNHIPSVLYNISSLGNIRDKDYQIGGTVKPGQVSKLDLYTGRADSICWVWNSDHTSGSYVAGDLEGCDLYTEPDVKDGLVTSTIYEEQNSSCAGSLEGEDGEVIEGLTSQSNQSGRASAGCDSNDQVIAFDMYFKLDQPSTIGLKDGSYIKNKGKTDYGLQNTLRVAFVTLGTQPKEYYYAEDKDVDETDGTLKTVKDKYAAKDSTPTTDKDHYSKLPVEVRDYWEAFGGYVGKYGARVMNTFGNITIWEPNSNKHTANAIEHARTNYGFDESITKGKYVSTHAIYSEIKGKRDAFPMKYEELDDEGKKTGNINTVSISNHEYLPLYMKETLSTKYGEFFAEQKLVDDLSAANTGKTDHKGNAATPYKNLINYQPRTQDTLDAKMNIFTAPAGVTKVRVYIWVEGSDIDTENNATSGTLDVSLQFTSAAAPGEAEPSADKYISYASQTNYSTESGNKKVWRDGTPADVKKPYKPTPGAGA